VNPTAHRRAKRKIGSPRFLHEEKAPVRKRRFSAVIYVEIEIDESLLTDVLTDEWQKNFYRLITAADVAGHLAYNLIQDRRLSSLDGFADQPEGAARILNVNAEDTQELPPHPEGSRASMLPLVRERHNGREYNWRCICGACGVTWQSTPKSAERDYQRHLGAETKNPQP
jgi:hypothetical protein